MPRSFAYDADGNMTGRGADTLSFDGWGRLSGGSFAGQTVSYQFDPAGFRRTRTSGTATSQYLLGGLFETDAAGTVTLTDVDAPQSDLAHYTGPPSLASTISFLYYSGHGDLAAEADGAGARTAAYSYDPFGSPLQSTPTNATSERWAGGFDKKLDTATGLIEMGARPYDAVLGRFLAVDPIEGGSANNYDYAGQDPVNTYDLDGLAFQFPTGAGGAIVIGSQIMRAITKKGGSRAAREAQSILDDLVSGAPGYGPSSVIIRTGSSDVAGGRAVATFNALARTAESVRTVGSGVRIATWDSGKIVLKLRPPILSKTGRSKKELIHSLDFQGWGFGQGKDFVKVMFSR